MEAIFEQLWPFVVAALPGLLLSGFAWLKAKAAATPEKWDDRVVSAVESIATAAVKKAQK